jgi:hypothetical protein
MSKYSYLTSSKLGVIERPGSGSGYDWTLDPGRDFGLDPDSQKTNADPKHCPKQKRVKSAKKKFTSGTTVPI